MRREGGGRRRGPQRGDGGDARLRGRREETRASEGGGARRAPHRQEWGDGRLRERRGNASDVCYTYSR